MTHLRNVDGQGQLLIGDHLSPMPYHVAIERRDTHYVARVEIKAPRDWLLQQGFRTQATLVLASGDRVQVAHEGPVNVDSSVSVVLRAATIDYADRKTLLAVFPEAQLDQD